MSKWNVALAITDAVRGKLREKHYQEFDFVGSVMFLRKPLPITCPTLFLTQITLTEQETHISQNKVSEHFQKFLLPINNKRMECSSL